jgi:MFS transporter, BCD family, chlorophyll transporter
VNPFSWLAILRLGLVQAALGSIVVLTTSTLNRVMVVELALPALLPGILVALHYGVQITRPRMGHGSDIGGRSTPWIIGGMLVLAVGGVLAAVATAWMQSHRAAGIGVAVLAFGLVGLGVGASGTSLLVLLAKRVAPERRGGAATLVWMMMIAGFAMTAGLAGKFLDPYSPERLVQVSGAVSAAAFVLTLLALYRVEGAAAALPQRPASAAPDFRRALSEVWAEPHARQFTIFVFISMLAYRAQDLILEPFAGTVFGLSPGASTQLSGLQHGGVLTGMLLVAVASSGAMRRVGLAPTSLRMWTVAGCLASALAMASLVLAGLFGPPWPLTASVFALGVANGAFSIAAIGSMMRLANEGRQTREGVRMGLWGAAQALAFALGGLVGTLASDVAHLLIAAPGTAYATVFALEAGLFVVSAVLAARIGVQRAQASMPPGSYNRPEQEPPVGRLDTAGMANHSSSPHPAPALRSAGPFPHMESR